MVWSWSPLFLHYLGFSKLLQFISLCLAPNLGSFYSWYFLALCSFFFLDTPKTQITYIFVFVWQNAKAILINSFSLYCSVWIIYPDPPSVSLIIFSAISILLISLCSKFHFFLNNMSYIPFLELLFLLFSEWFKLLSEAFCNNNFFKNALSNFNICVISSLVCPWFSSI